jgi:molecular chaperone Hsp33
MKSKDAINKINLQDRSIRVLSEDGFFKSVCVKNTATAQEAQKSHKYNQEVAQYHAKALTAASLLAANLKGEERIIVDIQSKGNVKRLFAEALQIGEVRGFAQYEKDSINDFEDSLMYISKIVYNENEPITGIVEFFDNDIAKDIEEYLLQSEQIPSIVFLDVCFDENGMIEQSGGLIVQIMPSAPSSGLNAIKEFIEKSESISELLKQSFRPDEILKKILPFNFEVIKSSRLDFFCRCSKDTFLTKLLTLGVNEIKSMKEEHHNELVCQYCNKHYPLDDEDFNKILLELQAKAN